MIGNICHLAGYSNPPAVFGNIKQAQKRDIDMLGRPNCAIILIACLIHRCQQRI